MNKKILAAAASLSLLPLAACGQKTDAAENVAAAADNSADMIDANATAIRDEGANIAENVQSAYDNTAAALNNRADAVRAAGENAADAMDAATKK